ncbi:MAG TPA: MFS transporter [Cyanobacteria bacterium UBA11149]|nr:MFS transporter [Cyanobacteria bacterium UBA11367]HBE60285.1 MFS transporter [Cyanobacteria bacterium UBA11366]HBK62553.1 MFS transporter [Cyanobacteria bacterium UBA11166]HBR77067.1 MFS transporter [Cyanobacteria bacterium UBA11159]HBS71414.1 MFS transporter [Cyanobacteria bacterium UBA11153]HBW89401.1 MFS transporter [Cyanobacteria bacterium UBA11149]HCA93523.1 MFS transporter [Cyanobacteria bacterium UBA9226]
MLKGLLSWRGRYRILHLTWFAFFLTFVAWFNFAPFATTIARELQLSPVQLKTLAICNLALTIPARIVIGMVLDKFGPRRTFSGLLMFALLPCLTTALSHSFDQLVWSRLLMGIVGAGFVVGIRMVSEWFPSKEIGIAEGIYGGWGNFGAAAAEFVLPMVALGTVFLSGGSSNWRLAITIVGIICALYSLVYLRLAQDTPEGVVYQRPKRHGSIEVTSVPSFYTMIAFNFGLLAAVGLMAWRLTQPGIAFLNQGQMLMIWAILAGLYGLQTYQAYQVNRELLRGQKIYTPAQRFQYRQIGLLNFAYVVSFGSELAVVSMLPAFFEHTFQLNHLTASMIAACYPFLNLFSRPSGGLISDRSGSRKWTLVAISLGIGISYLFASSVNSQWSLAFAIAITVIAAYFAQAGCGATFAIVPLIKKEIVGQISGSVGAYGNFGGLIYLTIFSLSNAKVLFESMGIAALICAGFCAFYLREPAILHSQSDREPKTLGRHKLG